eukprot:TRINITY_DN49262_c0_g1_i1.p1 TRINITY_DN49262_c0_g1~~TRINITY_DN49262_c0_g1_i1.p1  ORF type:complete len:557 (+),score=89.60 TRINITY_DN49262_c0_g1_i1:67-1737(+)
MSQPCSLGTLRRLRPLPENIVCLTSFGDGFVAVGSSDGVEVFPVDGSASVRQAGFVPECLVQLGSQTLAGGSNTGDVCVWHWRRNLLKQVMRASVHAAAVRGLGNGGDVLLTASDDGTVRQLNVLDDWAQSDFLDVGCPVRCVAFCGRRSVIVGCEDGRILEVSRRNADVMRRMDLGAPVQALDADNDDNSGARVVAAGGGRLAVWIRERFPRGAAGVAAAAAAAEKVTLPSVSWPVQDVVGVLLLPGDSRGLQDVITASALGGLCRGATTGQAFPNGAGVGGCPRGGGADEAFASFPAVSFVRGATETTCFVALRGACGVPSCVGQVAGCTPPVSPARASSPASLRRDMRVTAQDSGVRARTLLGVGASIISKAPTPQQTPVLFELELPRLAEIVAEAGEAADLVDPALSGRGFRGSATRRSGECGATATDSGFSSGACREPIATETGGGADQTKVATAALAGSGASSPSLLLDMTSGPGRPGSGNPASANTSAPGSSASASFDTGSIGILQGRALSSKGLPKRNTLYSDATEASRLRQSATFLQTVGQQRGTVT